MIPELNKGQDMRDLQAMVYENLNKRLFVQLSVWGQWGNIAWLEQGTPREKVLSRREEKSILKDFFPYFVLIWQIKGIHLYGPCNMI